MTTFIGGPAHGRTLQLKRVPYWLRVTKDGSKIDALNEVGDTARPNEQLFVYTRKEVTGHIHVNAKRGGGGVFYLASYVFHSEQPDDAILRDNAAWSAWVDRQPLPK